MGGWEQAALGWVGGGISLPAVTSDPEVKFCPPQNYRRLQTDFMEDDHERVVSVTSLSVQLFTVPTLVSTPHPPLHPHTPVSLSFSLSFSLYLSLSLSCSIFLPLVEL